MGSMDNTDEKFVIDWLYDEIREIVKNDMPEGLELKKSYFCRYILGGSIQDEKNCTNTVFKWGKNNSISKNFIEKLWETAKINENNFLGFSEIKEDSIKKVTVMVEEKLRKYIPNLEEYCETLSSVDRKIVVLIVCEVPNYIGNDIGSGAYKYYETEGQKEKLKEFLKLDVSADDSAKVIDISGPVLSGKHTLVYDVLNELYEEEKISVINIKEYQKDIINDNLRIEAERALYKHEELKKIQLFKGSSIAEKLEVIERKKKKVVVIDWEILGNSIISTEDYRQIWCRKDFKIIFIRNDDYGSRIRTRLYNIEELYKMFWLKLEILISKSKVESYKANVRIKEKIKNICMMANGQAFVIELLSLSVARCINDKKQSKDTITLIDDISEGDFIHESLKFRINGDSSPKCLSSHINIVYNNLLSDNERDVMLILSLFGECPIPEYYIRTKVNGVEEALSTLNKLGWVRKEKVGITIKLPFDFVLQIADKEEKARAVKKLEKFVDNLIDDIGNRYILFLPYYSIAVIICGISLRIKRLNIKRELLCKFFYAGIIFFIDLEFPQAAEEMLNEYNKINEDKKDIFSISCLELMVNWMKYELPDYYFLDKWVFNADEDDLRCLRVDEKILLIKIIKMLLDNYMNALFQNIKLFLYSSDVEEVKNEKKEAGIKIWQLAKLYVRLCKMINADDIYFQEKVVAGYLYAVMGICLLNWEIETGELEQVFKNSLIEEINEIITYICFKPYYTAEMIEERLNTLENIRFIRAIIIPCDKKSIEQICHGVFCDELWQKLRYVRYCIMSGIDARCLKLPLINKLNLGAEIENLIINKYLPMLENELID